MTRSGRRLRPDFSFFVEGGRQRRGLALAFADLLRNTDSLAPETRYLYYKGARRFNAFLDWRSGGRRSRDIGDVRTPADITEGILYEYQAWLRTLPRAPASAVCSYRAITGLLHRLRAHAPRSLALDRVPTWPRQRRSRSASTGDVLGIETLRRILAAAIPEMERIRAGHRRALAMLEETKDVPLDATMKPHGFWRDPKLALHALVRQHGFHRPLPHHLLGTFLKLHRVVPLEFRSPRALLGTFVPLGFPCLVPVLLVLLARTGLNPSSALALRRDCLQPHLHPDLAVLRFEKPRSGAARAKTMLVPRRQPNGVVDLLEFVKVWTDPLAEHAPHDFQDRMLLVVNSKRARQPSMIGPADEKSIHRALRGFQARHSLPPFTLVDLRPSIATYLYLETRDVFRVKRFLGHVSVTTTLRYIRGRVVRDQHNEALAEGITQLLSRLDPAGDAHSAAGGSSPAGEIPSSLLSPEEHGSLRRSGALTLVGRCRDPLDSPQPGERRGRVCTSLLVCIRCPNIAIVKEDLPRVLRFREWLTAERCSLTEAAWIATYGATWNALGSVIGSFSRESVRRAEAALMQGAS